MTKLILFTDTEWGTSKLKDVVIEAKNKRIAKLEEEHQKLGIKMQQLRYMLYKKTCSNDMLEQRNT